MAEVEERRTRGRQCLRWKDGVKSIDMQFSARSLRFNIKFEKRFIFKVIIIARLTC